MLLIERDVLIAYFVCIDYNVHLESIAHTLEVLYLANIVDSVHTVHKIYIVCIVETSTLLTSYVLCIVYGETKRTFGPWNPREHARNQ